MFLTILMFVVALSLSSVAAFYSIVGLTAIFAAAVMPIIIMGSILEVAKLAVTVWLHEYWHQCRWVMKAYLVPAVGVLMLLTSMGIFGFLSKAHLDQTVPTGDVAAQIGLIDEKIRTQRDNVETARTALKQMDEQVNARLTRSDDEKGAERAVQIRRQQASERQRIQADIASAQKIIAQLNEERAPIASQLRKAEAEVGPIKYIAALIYGDNPDANLLERAVRWVIIVLGLVFDPLAVFMLLAWTESRAWERQRSRETIAAAPPDPEPQAEPAAPELTTPEVVFPPRQPDPEPGPVDLEPDHVPDPIVVHDHAEPPVPDIVETDDDEATELDPRVKEAMRLWKQQNPGRTVKSERERLRRGHISELPWTALLAQLPREPINHFGAMAPDQPQRGDTWVNTTSMPHTLMKDTGDAWILVDKDQNSSYTYDLAYIDWLIHEIEASRYDPDLLTPDETQQIQTRLQENRP